MTCQIYAQPGTTGLSFLKNGTGARSQAMGEAAVAASSDPTAIYYNPANISLLRDVQFDITHKSWMQDMSTDYIAAVVPWKSFNFGLSINSSSVDNIELRTKPGDPEGYFSAHNIAIGLTTAFKVHPNIGLGFTAKYLYEKIYVDEASGYAFDAGGYYRTPWDLDIAFSVSNIGAMSTLKDEATKLPLIVRLGAAYERPWKSIDGIISFTADLVSYPIDETFHFHAGTEILVKDVVAFRIGYVSGYETRSISAGLGVRYSFFSLGYAYVPFNNNFQSSHTLSLGITIK
jgi:Uncharacterised protein family (UPF0164)